MRTTGIVALAAGFLLIGVIMAVTLFFDGGQQATADQSDQTRNLVVQPRSTEAPAASYDMAGAVSDLFGAINDRLQNAADTTQAQSDAGEADDKDCTTEVERGTGWERTTTTCIKQEIVRDGNSISVSTSTSTSVSTSSTN